MEKLILQTATNTEGNYIVATHTTVH